MTGTGVITMANLAGTGSRAVLASSTGVLSAPLSDIFLKKNIKPIGGNIAMEMLADEKIKGVQFNWRDESKGNDTELGFVYQDFAPYKVAGLTFFDNGFGGINYDKLTVILWEQNRQLLRRIERLENK